MLSEFVRSIANSSGEFFAALAGALFGALAAYYFQRKSEQQRQREDQHAAIVQSQLVLGSQLNTLWNIETLFLARFRQLSDRHLKMPLFWQEGSALNVDYDRLSFLLMTDNSNLVSEVHVAEGSFRTAISMLRSWNQSVERLHNRCELQHMDPETGECRIKADPRDVKLVKDAADHLFESIDDATKKCDKAVKDLKAAGKLLFPKSRFLTVEKADSAIG